MLDTTQIILITALTITTIILSIIGIQVFLVLREIRNIMTRIRNAVDSFEKVGISLGSGYSELLGFISGFRNIFNLFKVLSERKNRKK